MITFLFIFNMISIKTILTAMDHQFAPQVQDIFSNIVDGFETVIFVCTALITNVGILIQKNKYNIGRSGTILKLPKF